MNLDSGFYAMFAERVSKGAVPYIDFPSLYTPLFYYWQGWLQSIFGLTCTSLQIEVWVHHVTLGLILAVTARRHLQLSWSAVCYLLAIYFPLTTTLMGNGLFVEMAVNVWGWLGLLLALERLRLGDEKSAPAVVWALTAISGCFAGLAFWCKQVGAVLAAVTFAAMLVRPARCRIREMVLWAVGFVLPGGLFFAAHPAALAPFVQMTILNLFKYASAEGEFRVDRSYVPHQVRHFFWAPAMLGILFAECCDRAREVVASSGIRAVQERDAISMGLCAAGFILYLPFLGRGHPHYLQLVLPCILLPAAYVWTTLSGKPRARLLAHLAIPVLALATSIRGDLRGVVGSAVAKPSGREVANQIAEWMKREAKGADSILILECAPQFYILAGKHSATGMYTYPQEVSDVSAALARRVPTFLLWNGTNAGDDWIPLLRKFGYSQVSSLDQRHQAWMPVPPPAGKT